MRTHILLLPDGREIGSGTSGEALMAVRLTREVNNDTLLSPGAASAAMLELSLLTPDKPVRAGDSLRLLDAGSGQLLGTFIAQEPVSAGGLQKITAYDCLVRLDREVSGLLRQLSWPRSLSQLAMDICQFCGLTLATPDFPCGEFPAACPSGDAITGRQVMMWVSQAAGCFCRATAQGEVALGWYTPANLEIAPQQVRFLGGVLSLSGKVDEGVLPLSGSVEAAVLTLTPRQYALSGELQLETGEIAPIDRVQIRQTETDVGVLYPDAPGENTLVIQGNPLLAAQDAQMLLPVAESLYERFGGITYTPGRIKVPTTKGLDVGQILQVTDSQGERHTLYVMSLLRDATGDTVACTGCVNRDSPQVVNNRSYQNLHGRMLQLRTDVEGIRAENSDNRGKLSALALDVEGIRGSVSAQQTQGQLLQQSLTTLEQTAQGLQLSVESIQTQGATKLKTAMGYRFDDEGLRIARSGQPMENRLDNTGMQVLRSGTPILQADHRGVMAQDVTVKNYLIVGSHARFEDAAGRTACFWLEG